MIWLTLVFLLKAMEAERYPKIIIKIQQNNSRPKNKSNVQAVA